MHTYQQKQLRLGRWPHDQGESITRCLFLVRTGCGSRFCQADHRRQRHTYEQIAVLRSRQARRRQDWLHKTTTDLAKSHGVVVIEDLRIQNLTRSARGTIEHPGSNVRAKAGLNRSILSMAWGMAEHMLGYKCPTQGGVLIKVDPRGSSTECPRCGRCSPISRLNQATFRCVACRHAANADTNAAQVLLERGLTALSGATPGCGGTAREARLPVPHREPLPAMPAGQGHPDGPGASSCRS